MKIEIPKKPVYRPVSWDLDFFEIFKRIESAYDTCYLLESLGEESHVSRYSIIGFDPDHTIIGRPGELIFDGESIKTENPYLKLRDIIPTDIYSRNYSGGLVGYIGYDAVNFFEPKLKVSHHSQFDPFLFGVYTDGLLYDKITGEIIYFYFTKDRFSELDNLIHSKPIEVKTPVVIFKGFSKSKEEHKQMVEATIEEIRKGNTYQCQIGFQANYEIKGSYLPIYEELRSINPSPHMYYLKLGEKRIVGASPELVFRLRKGEMETYPLAGTIARGSTPKEDQQLARKLLYDPKEISEHNMLVDLHRNDIGRVARFGTVRVRRLMDIKRFSHVQHISSEVVGHINSKDDMFSGLESVFPAGTLSGSPKIESMKIIQRLEGDARGPYGGAIGHFGFDGDCTFAIPIRTLFANGEDAFNRASGGIVIDSTSDGEYQEIQNKLAGIRRALERFLYQP